MIRLLSELEEWRLSQLVLPDETQTEHDLRCAFAAQRFLMAHHRDIMRCEEQDPMVVKRFAVEYWELRADGQVVKVRESLMSIPEWVKEAASDWGIPL